VGTAAPRETGCRCSGTSGRQVVREVGQILGAVLGHEHEILEPDATVALPVEPRLDRDDVAHLQFVLRGEAQTGLLVYLEPDAVTESVEEPVDQRNARLLGAL